jgi:multiple sugar transport system ATP-binding protein
LGQPRINVLPADVFGVAPNGATQIGMRPEHIVQGQGLEAQVQRVEHLGDQNRLHLVLQGHPIITIADPSTTYEPGATLKIAPKNPLCFDAAGIRIR